jgi:ribonuclease D
MPMATLTEPQFDAGVCWIDNDAELARACVGWQQVEALALDTEFVRRTTFYPIPALLQCYDGVTVSVIDPVTINNWQPLVEVMADPAVLKIFHASSEDIEVFWRLLGMTPAPLFDTQLAAGLCGMRPTMGYHKLVAELLQCDLPKDQTQSDWLIRPLSEKQLRYAAHDVYYLHAAYLLLIDTARRLGRLDWVLQESAALGHSLSTLLPPDSYYLRVKGAWRLSRRELAVARELCAWREQQARHHDRPRNWILKDAAVLALAQQQPASLATLATIDGIMPSTVRKEGASLLLEIERALALSQQQWPAELPKPNAPAVKAPLAVLQQGVSACAERLGIAPELLLSRRQQDAVLAAWISGGQAVLPASCNSAWRRTLLQPTLAQMDSL